MGALNIDEISVDSSAPAKKPVILKANLIQDEDTAYGESGHSVTALTSECA